MIKRLMFLLLCYRVLIVLLASSFAVQANIVFHPNQAVTVCDAKVQPELPINYATAGCQQVALHQVDPQGRLIWLQIAFSVDETQLQALQPPLGLYLLGKASSSVYINGYYLGSNGVPAEQGAEIAGLMDSRFYLPKSALQSGDNTLQIKLSSHQNLLTLPNPMHFLAISSYRDAQFYVQQHGKFMLVLLGVFLTATLYFAVRAMTPVHRLSHGLLALMSLFASLQLLAEISRGLIDYAYPFHDVRLIFICLLSLSFGLCLLAFIARRYSRRFALHWIYGGALVTLVAVMSVVGFDTKTTVATFFPALAAAILTGISWFRDRNRQAGATALALSTFLLIIVGTAQFFHESIYFVLIALLLTYLFIQQALDYNAQQVMRERDKVTIAKLTLHLEQSSHRSTPSTLKLSSAGKLDFISTDNINFCLAAGDYTEINLLDGRQHLYSGTLKSLESELPSTFLRVHRSYLVNLTQVKRLITSADKQQGSAASLQLENGQTVPVSRRLIPAVRSAVVAVNE